MTDRNMNITNVLLVGAGGFAGSVARYLTVFSLEKRYNTIFPFGTLTVNLLGCFFLGCILGWIAGRTSETSEEWKLLLGTGFCGGFTTFSAFAMENIGLLQQRLPSGATFYTLASVAGGLLAAWLGLALSRTLF